MTDEEIMASVRRRMDAHFTKSPEIHPSAFVAAGASVLGNVTLCEESSVWFHCTLRGDINRILLGPRSNIQDNSVVHLADDHGVEIGEWVTIGHAAVIHACTISDEVLVGMGTTVLDGAEIGPRCIIGANALVTGRTRIPEGSLVLGSPAKVVRSLDRAACRSIRTWAVKYVEVARRFREAAMTGSKPTSLVPRE